MRKLIMTLGAAVAAICPSLLLADPLVVGNETIDYDSGERTYDSLKMGDNGNNWITSTLNLSGDSSTTFGEVTMGCNKSNTKSYLKVLGSATATFGNFTCLKSFTISNNRVAFSVEDDAVVSFGSFTCGTANNTHYADVTFAGDCHVDQKPGCSISVSHATTYLTVMAKDRAQVGLAKPQIGKAGDQLKVQDHATLTVAAGSMSARTDACDVSGDASLVITGQCFQVLGGGGLTLRDRARGYVTSSGMLQLGHNSSGWSVLVISNSASFVSTNSIRASRGLGYPSDREQIALRLYGGLLQFPGFTYGTPGIGDNGYKNMALLYADGGTIKAMKANDSFIRYWQTAELAGAGLTLDTEGYATGVQQAFTGTAFTKTGDGVLTVKLASTHETTAVAGGTLLFASGVTTFGNHLVVTNGATVSTAGTSTGFAVDEITLGNAASAGILNLDAGDTVTVASAAGLHFADGKVNHPSAATDGTYDVFLVTSGVPTAEQLAGLQIYTKTLGKKYKFQAVADGDGAKVQLVVTTATIVEDTWTGAVDGAWRTTGNWASDAYADELTIATFPATAARKDIANDFADAANRMILEDSYSFSGAGSLTTGAIDVNAGTSTVDVAFNVASDVSVSTPVGTRLDFGGNMTGTEAVTVSKTGAGVIRVSGDNAAYRGAWTTDGGYLVFDGDTAPGAAEETTATWTQTGGTIVFTNGTQTIGRGLTMNPGSSLGAVICADGDTTVLGGFTSSSGAYVQRGAGRLTLRYGLGTKTLGKDLLSGLPTGAVTFPEDGSSPASGLAAVNVLSGTLRLVGQGVNSTTWSEDNVNVIVGGNWAGAPASARLEVSAGTLSNNSRTTVVGNYVSSPNATRPTLSVGSGGVVTSHYLTFGSQNSDFAGDVYPWLAVTNGTAQSFYDLSFGSDSTSSRLHPRLRIGAGGLVYQRAAVGRYFKTIGVVIGHDIDAEVANGGVLQSSARAWGLLLTPAASGEMRFVNGGKLAVSFISSQAAATTVAPFKFVFDGGVYEPLHSHTTSVHNAALRTIELRGAGLTYQSSYNHTLAMRLTGTGDFVKMGSKTLTFPAKNDCVIHSNSSVADDHTPNDDYITLGDSGFKTLDFTGTLRVEAGSVVIEPGAARAGLKVDVALGKSVDFGGGQIDAYVVSGAGTVKNAVGGALTVAAADGVTPVLDGLKLGILKVDFAAYDGTLKKGDIVTVAKLANGATVGRFKALNVGERLTARFAVEANGDVLATVGDKDGFSITVR